MKKSDLETIIKKIQNRCYLEEPTKITYYWNEDHQVVFKIFFESLYLPKELRVDEENIQNNFVTQNVYEYKDDFTILELNQDEGYIKVLPDDQNFKIIHNYREANKDESIEESRKIHLSTKNIKEVFAASKGYLLQETPEKISTENDTPKDAVDKEEKKEKVDADVYVISTAFALCNKALDNGGILNKAIQEVVNLINKKTDIKAKLVFSIPKVISEDLSGTISNSINSFSNILKKGTGDTYAYLAREGNVTLSNLLKDINVKNTYFITSTAEDAIKQANMPDLLKTANAEGISVIEDTTKEDLTNAREVALKAIDSYRKDVKKKGGVHKDFSKGGLFNGKKNWDKRRKFLEEKLKSEDGKKINAALTFCMDLYGNNASDADREYAKERKKIIDNNINGVKNIGNSEETLEWYEKVAISLKSAFTAGLDAAKGEIVRGLNSKSEETVSVDSGMIKNSNFGGATAGLKKSKNTNIDKSPKEPKKDNLNVTDYFGDFPIKVAVNSTGTGLNSTFEELLKFFSENVTADQLENFSSEEENSEENQNKETKPKEQTKDQSNEEADDLESAEEADDLESADSTTQEENN